jgi:hypothetical protein
VIVSFIVAALILSVVSAWATANFVNRMIMDGILHPKYIRRASYMWPYLLAKHFYLVWTVGGDYVLIGETEDD